ncbi:PspC domain-containing protein [Cryptosporangium japonicum]|uniref:Phage shock protein C (PspC) family protein n=1 Tax=Cryptosporangium japonicum TaxID=80872 RepID=A0ABP3D9H6_9ACTN
MDSLDPRREPTPDSGSTPPSGSAAAPDSASGGPTPSAGPTDPTPHRDAAASDVPPAPDAPDAPDAPAPPAPPPPPPPPSGEEPSGATPPGPMPPHGGAPPHGGMPPFGGGAWSTGGGSGWNWNRGRTLTRTRQGKLVAGVCAGLGRTTGVDPILFRVILTVLVFFGGVGALLYLVAWIALPVDDEPASPLESLLGRGRSGTSPAATVGLIVLAALLLIGSLSNGFASTALLAACLIGGMMLLRRAGGHGGFPAAPAGPTGPVPDGTLGFTPPAGGPWVPASAPNPGTPNPGTAAPGATPTASDAPVTDAFHAPGHQPSAPAASTPTTEAAPATAGVPGPAAPPYGAPSPGVPYAGAPSTGAPYAAAPSTGAPPQFGPYHTGHHGAPGQPYTQPFAPYGPYAPVSGPGVVPPPPPYPPVGYPGKRKKERSVLGRLTFSIACLAIVVLLIVNASGVHIPFTGFVALALGIVAVGLFVGVWIGRARWLIPIGLVLAVALGIGSIAENVDGGPDHQRSNVDFVPTTLADVRPSYSLGGGDFDLDLRNVDFTGVTRTIEVNTGFGDTTVQLPDDVDVTVQYDLGAGDARIFENRQSGMGVTNSVTDYGENGADTSDLTLVVHHGAGDLEVTR